MKDDKELDEIFDEFIATAYNKGVDNELKNEAKAAIQSLIDTRVREARIDELLFLTNHSDPLILDRVWMANRIDELKEGKQDG